MLRFDRLLATGLLVLLTVALIVTLLYSLNWRYAHDAPILLYISLLKDHFGYVPYRDVFDMNMPGSYVAYSLIGRFSGYTDQGVRCADLLILTATMLLTFLWMRRFGSRAAWLGAVLWGLAYSSSGPKMSLQREFLVILPISAAVCTHFLLEKRIVLRRVAVGLFFGIAATMKPHAAMGFPLLLLAEFFQSFPRVGAGSSARVRVKLLARAVLPGIAGFLIPLLALLFHLWRTGALSPFLDIAVNYWPLYTHLDGNHATISGMRRVFYLINGYRELGTNMAWLTPALVGAYIALHAPSARDSRQKQDVQLLIALTACYSIYPVLAGQFWRYHWFLFLYFVIQLAALCFTEQSEVLTARKRLLPVALVVFALLFWIPLDVYQSMLGRREMPPPKGGRVDRIAMYLQANLQPGDTVQPLDWVGGAVHAMLITKAKPATPFIYDFHFYHHVSSRYIQDLRKTFISDLRKAAPRFVIEITAEDKPWVSGADTTREFKELQSVLDEDYVIVDCRDGYNIRQRKVEAGALFLGRAWRF